jgi:hypothetical protein
LYRKVEAEDPLLEGLAAWYKFEEGTGSIAGDSSGNGNHAILQNMEEADWVTDQGKPALNFDGITASEFAQAPNSPSLQITGALTLSTFVTIDSVSNSQNAGILAKFRGNAAEGYTNQRGYLLDITPSRIIEFGISVNGASSGTKYVPANTALTLGTQYHIAGVFTPSTKMEVFIDGVLDNAGVVSIPAQVHNTTAQFWLACQYQRAITGSGHYLTINGKLADTRIYNRALSASEIATLAGL